MSRKSLVVCVLVAVLAYWAGTSAQPQSGRPVLRWLSRAAGLWLLFRDEPPPQENARYVHAIGADAIDHRNAL